MTRPSHFPKPLLLPLALAAAASVVAAHTACSVPEGRATYERGALVRPPPPPTRPGVGAPVIGQPGQLRPDIPRTPHKRLLPPATGPGLWGTADVPDPGPFLFDVALPYEDMLTPQGREVTHKCASMLAGAVSRSNNSERISKMKPELRRCLAGRLYSWCAQRSADAEEKRAATENRSPRPHYERAHRAAIAFRDDACRDVAVDATDPMVVSILKYI